MGGDYHIYLHSEEQSTLASNTQPKDDALGGAFKPTNFMKDIKQFGKSGFSSFINTGVSNLSKALPIVGTVVAAGAVTNKVLTVGFEHLSNYTGHYEYSMGFNNFKTTISHVINPIGYVKQLVHRQFEINKQNQEIELQSQLLGETVFSTKKVGL